jgi:hypothetical protein
MLVGRENSNVILLTSICRRYCFQVEFISCNHRGDIVVVSLPECFVTSTFVKTNSVMVIHMGMRLRFRKAREV